MIRKLLRRTLTALAALSLVLCLAVTALAVRSYWRMDSLSRMNWDPNRRATRVFKIDSVNGSLMFQSRSVTYGPQHDVRTRGYTELQGWYFYADPNMPDAKWWAGLSIFSYYRNGGRNPTGPWSIIELTFPHWLLVLLSGILPAVRLVQWRRVRRLRRLGHCLRCGYDLRASPDRCPECGTVPGGNRSSGVGASA